MKQIGLALFSLFFFSICANAQIRTYSNEFLAIGVGGRALAMGNAQVANVNDVTAAYWNPAGLNNVKTAELFFQHAQWFAGAGDYNYAGLVVPINNGQQKVGLSYIRFAVDDIPNTLNLIQSDGTVNYDNIEFFSAADNAIVLSYARKFANIDNLNIGGNVKIIRRKVGTFADSWGFGIDLAAQYTFDFGLQVGANLRDATTTPNSWSFNWTEQEQAVLAQTGNEIPISSTELTAQRLILGTAYTHRFGSKSSNTNEPTFGIMGAMDIDVTFDGKRNTFVSAGISLDPHFGIEFDYDQFIFLRAGMNNIQRGLGENTEQGSKLIASPSAGVGLKIKRLSIDYAFTGLNSLSTGFYSNVVSVRLDLKRQE